ncbi:MAG: hypothetical protein ACYTET_04750, partial [Planctomycetota bacterium]
MKKQIYSVTIIGLLISFITAPLCWGQEVNWNGPSGGKIKGIRYIRKDEPQPEMATRTTSVFTHVIDSPPVDGFVPWVVLTATDEYIDPETTGIYDAFPSSYYIGDPPAGTDPRTDYMIALFDTGASSIVIGYENAVRAGLY